LYPGEGSLFECQNHIIDAFDCNYITAEELEILEGKTVIVEKLLNGYMAWLKKKIDEPKSKE
jgi:hypothetical protein